MENDVYKAPESDVTIVADESADILASRWSRFGASIVDGIILGLIIMPVMFFAGIFETIMAGGDPSFLVLLGVTAVWIIVFVLLNGKLLVNHGQTIAKRLFNIKIVLNDNKKADMTALLKRYGFSMLIPQIPLIGQWISIVNVLFIFSSSKRCVHDLIANTKVVKA